MEKLHSKKFIFIFLVICIFVVLAGCFGLSWNEMRIKEYDISSNRMLSAEEGAVVYIDAAYYEENGYEKNKLSIRGWAVIQGRESLPVAIKVIIQDTQTKESYLLPTAIEQRTAVTDYFADGINYDYSGFDVDTYYDDFDFSNHQYKILILYEVADEKYIMDSGYYITSKPEEEN